MKDSQLKKLRAEVNLLLDLGRTAYRDFLFLRPMLGNRELNGRLDGTQKGPAFNRLRTVLYWSFIQQLVKVCDDRDQHGRATSIRKLCKAISEGVDLQSVLEARYCRWSPPRAHTLATELVEQIKEKEQTELREEFRTRLSRLMKNCNRLFSSPALHSYTKVRHKLIAHTEVMDAEDGTVRRFDVQQEGLKFGNERQLLDQMISVLNDLLSLIDGSEFSWESDRKLHAADTCAFWELNLSNN